MEALNEQKKTLSEEERNEQRKNFNRLTDQQKIKLEKEVTELFEWNRNKRKELEDELKKDRKWLYFGLDSNQQYFAEIIKEFNERFRALQIKYGIIQGVK